MDQVRRRRLMRRQRFRTIRRMWERARRSIAAHILAANCIYSKTTAITTNCTAEDRRSELSVFTPFDAMSAGKNYLPCAGDLIQERPRRRPRISELVVTASGKFTRRDTITVQAAAVVPVCRPRLQPLFRRRSQTEIFAWFTLNMADIRRAMRVRLRPESWEPLE